MIINWYPCLASYNLYFRIILLDRYCFTVIFLRLHAGKSPRTTQYSRRFVWADCVQRPATHQLLRLEPVYIIRMHADEMRRHLYTEENGRAQLCANSDQRILYYNLHWALKYNNSKATERFRTGRVRRGVKKKPNTFTSYPPTTLPYYIRYTQKTTVARNPHTTSQKFNNTILLFKYEFNVYLE